jgi:hypothetical protein
MLVWTLWLAACAPDVPEQSAPVPAEETFGCLELTPSALDFGDVLLRTETDEQLVSLTNACDGELALYGAQIVGSTDFWVGAPDALALAPGDTTDVAVTWRPTALGAVEVDLMVESSDPGSPHAVTLRGTGLGPWLVVEPPVVDFGEPYLGCELRSPIRLANEGNLPLTLESVTIAPSEAFELDLENTLPLTIPGGAEVAAYVTFDAITPGPHESIVEVRSDDPLRPYAEVGVRGEIVRYGDIVDRFVVPYEPAADFLVVVDDGNTAVTERDQLVADAHALVDALDAAGADWQIAVITTSDPAFAGSVLTPADADPIGSLEAAIASLGGGIGRAGMERAWEATQPGGDAAPGGAFLRDGAKLHILFFTDNYDTSADTPANYVDHWLSIKGDDPALLRVHAIAGDVPTPTCATAFPGSPLDEAVALTGGVFASICAASYSAALAIIAAEAVSEPRFALTAPPVPATIEVTVDGVAATGWAYDATTLEVVFDLDHAPAAEAAVEVAYALMPDCDG